MKGVSRLLSVLFLSLAISVVAVAAGIEDQPLIATTGNITKIDSQHRSFKVRSANHETRTESEYTVVVTGSTELRNDIDPIGFNDFKVGESLSIWGTLNGSTLTATRISKWPE